MTDKKRHAFVLLITFIIIFIIYQLSTVLHSSSNVYNKEDDYLSRYLLPEKDQKVATTGVTDSRQSSFYNFDEGTNFIESGPNKSIYKTNITSAVFKTGSTESMIKVSHFEAKQKRYDRNVFFKMKYITKSTKNIFFIESRCATEKMAVYFKNSKGFVLNARQCCAIESTARMNLDHNVYIFHSCLLDDNFFQYSSKFVEKLFLLPNVHVVRLNTTEIFMGSPVEELHTKKVLETSVYPVEHTSDLLRLTLLWRFGGTYNDLDVVTIRPFDNLKTNWAGMQDEVTIGNGVMNLEPEGAGHRIVQTALEHVNRHYNPSAWSANGPQLITPIILQECKVNTVIEAQKHCNGNVTVLDKSILYHIYYTSARDFFDSSLGEQIVSQVKQNSYSVHIWNKMSYDLSITVGSNQAYALLADEYCPQVYRNCGPSF